MLRSLIARLNRWLAPAAVAASTERTGGSADGPDAVAAASIMTEIDEQTEKNAEADA